MNYEDIEASIITQLQPISAANVDVVALPEKQADFTPQFVRPRVTVVYAGNELRDTALPDTDSVMKSMGFSVQTKLLLFDISTEARSLRGDAGIYKLLGAIEMLLIGFKPVNCDKMYQMSCLATGYDKGTFTYTFRWACKTMLVEQEPVETGANLSQVSFKEVIGEFIPDPIVIYPPDGIVFPPTPPASSGALSEVNFIASEDIPAFSFVTSTGYIADSNNTAHLGKVIGMVTSDVLTHHIGAAVNTGEVNNPLWAFSIGQTIFINDNSFSTTPPVSGWLQFVANVTQRNSLAIQLSQPILL